MEDLSRDFSLGGQQIVALDSIDLTIGEGELVAIMGPSGSGKSTLLNIIGLLDSPTHGRYFLEGEEVGDIGSDQRALLRNRKIGFVFQSFNLLSRTSARENVELPLLYSGIPSQERKRRAIGALAEVGLEQRMAHSPNQLSGGEQQRVAIARALVCDPLLILADEPTGALDSSTGAEIMTLLLRLHQSGRTIVTATHDPDVARCAERILLIRDGRIVDDRSMQAKDPPTTAAASQELTSFTVIRRGVR